MSGVKPTFPQYALMAWFSVKKKQRDNFTFTSIQNRTMWKHNAMH